MISTQETPEPLRAKKASSLGGLAKRRPRASRQAATHPVSAPSPTAPTVAASQEGSPGTTARHVPSVSFDFLSGGYRQMRHVAAVNRLALGGMALLLLVAIGAGVSWQHAREAATVKLQGLRSQAATINAKVTGSSQVSLSEVRAFDNKVAAQITGILATQPNVSAILSEILATQSTGVQITSITIPPVAGSTSTSTSTSSTSSAAPTSLSISGDASSYPAVAQWELRLQTLASSVSAPFSNVKVSYSGTNGQIAVTATGTLTKAASISPLPYQTDLGATAP